MTNRIKSITIRLIVIALAVTIITFTAYEVKDLGEHPAVHMSTVQYQLLMKIENGDTEAIKEYISDYIEDDIYLFDGPLTLRLMSDRNDWDISLLKEIKEFHEFTNQELYDFMIRSGKGGVKYYG